MYLLPYPQDPGLPPVEIPYVATFDYAFDNSVYDYFDNFAVQCGFGNVGLAGFSQAGGLQERSLEELASLMQSWLFL